MAIHWGGVTNNTSHFGAYINMYEIANSVNVAENTSRVGVEFHITRSNFGWIAGAAQSGNIVIDGITFPFQYQPNWPYASSGDVTIAYFEATVKHNDDGSKWCDASATWWTSGTYSCGTASASGGISLTTIPRASGIACSSPYIGDTATITIDRKSASFTNTITYDIGGIKGIIAEKTSETVLSLRTEELVDKIYALIPNATQIQGTVYCTTYNGNTQIGSTTSASFYLYAKEADCKPDVSGTIVDTNETTIALTGDSSTIVKYASIPKVIVNAAAKKSATIKSYNINANDGQQVNLQEYTFANGIASDEVTINAKDSRGFGNPKNLTPKVIDYIPIIINVFKGERTEDVSSEVILNAGGVWFNGEFKEGTPNTLYCIFYYRESDSNEWIEGSELIPTIEGNTFRFENYSLGNLFDYEKQWQIKLKIQDLTGYAERDDLNISKGQEVVAIGDDKVWVNGETELNGNLDINGDIKQNGKIREPFIYDKTKYSKVQLKDRDGNSIYPEDYLAFDNAGGYSTVGGIWTRFARTKIKGMWTNGYAVFVIGGGIITSGIAIVYIDIYKDGSGGEGFASYCRGLYSGFSPDNFKGVVVSNNGEDIVIDWYCHSLRSYGGWNSKLLVTQGFAEIDQNIESIEGLPSGTQIGFA